MLVIKDSDLCKYDSFDKIDIKVISDGDVAKLKAKAKYTYYKYFDELIESGKYNGKVLDFDNSVCLITTSSLDGGYIPDSEIIECLSFINGKCIVIVK